MESSIAIDESMHAHSHEMSEGKKSFSSFYGSYPPKDMGIFPDFGMSKIVWKIGV